MLHFIFPTTCIFCGSVCRKSRLFSVCNRCYGELPFRNSWYSNTSCPVYFFGNSDTFVCPFSYVGRISSAITSMKFKDARYVCHTLGDAIYQMLLRQNLVNRIDIVTFVPLHNSRLTMRGYNQAEDIAMDVSSRMGKKCLPLMKKDINTAPQSSVNREIRYKSAVDIYSILSCKDIKNKTILLVDDVITTGATIDSCGKCLKSAGVNRIIYAAAASGKR